MRQQRGQARLIGTIRRNRGGLLVTSALSAAVLGLLALPAQAQLAPDTQPSGGRVVAGAARIGATATTTTITQGSPRAAINWQMFNVGSAASVNFVQPSASAVTLNRVIAADPSVVAGHLHANGGIVITNQSGVVFTKGSEVNAASVLVSAAGITNRNFMAGRMQFDIPARPGARVVNAGRITVKNAGLAALVAPEVANSGVIAAKLGQVVLAGGAKAETLDLYGDGLVSLDITPEARSVTLPDGARATALVTNSGTIIAAGGRVLLTARQADGLVQDLVDAGGTIAANSLGAHTGTIAITGIGGSVRIPGTLLAEGSAPGTKGGAIALDATGSVAVGAQARIDASGAAGGGVVALGTTLARARGGPGTASTLTASGVSIAPGARIAADATTMGDGGRVAVLSLGTTRMAGSIAAHGGRLGGDGGSVEISGENLTLSGHVDAGAPLGITGTILLDPDNLKIVASGSNDKTDITTSPLNGVAFDANGTTSADTVSAGSIEALSGNVTLQAFHDLEIATNLTMTVTNQSLTLQAGNDVTIDSGVLVSTTGSLANIEIDAASSAITGHGTIGAVEIQGSVIAGGNLSLTAGTGGISIDHGSVSGDALSFNTTGAISDAVGSITATTLSGSGTGADLTGSNTIGTLGGFTATTGGLGLTDGEALIIAGVVNAGTSNVGITTTKGGLSESSTGSITAGTLTGNIAAGVALGGANSIGALGDFGAADGLSLTDGEALAITGAVSAGTTPSSNVAITTTKGGLSESGAGSITGATLTGDIAAGVSLGGSNSIVALGDFGAGGNFSFSDKSALSVNGGVTVPSGDSLAIQADTLQFGSAGSLTATGGTVVLAPFTAGDAIALNPKGSSSGTLDVTTGDLGQISASVLQLGTTGGGPIIIGRSGPITTIPTTTAATLALVGGASVTEAGGLDVGTLTGAITGPVTLDEANTITTLGDFSAGTLILTNTGSLTIAGAVTVGGGTGAFTLKNDGSLSEISPGSISAGTLSGNADFASLTGANEIATLAAFTATGGFSLTDGESLTIAGLLDAGSDEAVLNVTGSIGESSSGSINAGILSGSAVSVALGEANTIGTLAAFTATGGNFSLTEAKGQPLFVDGAVSAGNISLTADGIAIGNETVVAGGITSVIVGSLAAGTAGEVALAQVNPGSSLVVGTGGSVASLGTFSLGPAAGSAAISAGTLAIGAAPGGAAIRVAGSIGLPDVGLLDLLSGQAISETSADSLSVGSLAADAASASLIGSLNAIGALGSISVTGGFTLDDSESLTVAGPLDAQNSIVNFPTIAGSLTETGAGKVVAGLLEGSATSASLATTNAIGTLGAFSALGGFTLADSGNLQLAGPLDAGTATVLLTDSPTVTEPTGSSITAGTFTGTLASASLTGSNAIGTLGDVTLTGSGGFTLTDSENLVLAGLISAGSQSVQLNDAGFALSESGGSVTAGTFGGDATSATLTGANEIGTLGAFSATSGLSLTNDQALTIGGLVNAGSGEANFVINGGGLGESGGSITAGTLTGSAVSVALGDANTIGTLAAFTATGGNFSLTEAEGQPLLVDGTVSAGNISLTADGITIAGPTFPPGGPVGSLSAPVGTVQLSSATPALPLTLNTEGSGAALGTFSLGSAFSFGVAPVSAATLIVGSTSGGAITIGGPVFLPDVGILDLLSSGQVSEPSGELNVQTLAADVQSATLTGSNSVGTLGGVTATGGFTLDDTESLVLADLLDAGNSSVSFTINGGSLVENGGSITAGLLAGTFTSASLTGANTIAALGGITLTGSGGFTLDDGENLTLTGLVSAGSNTVELDDPGFALSETGGSIGAGTGTLTGIAESVTLSGANDIGTLGNFSATGGFTLTNDQPLIVGGSLNAGSGEAFFDVTAGGLSGTGAVTAGTLAGSASFVSLGGTNKIGTLGAFAATGGFSLTDDAPLTITGLLNAGGSEAFFQITGGLSEVSPGAIDAGTLAGSAGSVGLTGANSIGQVGSFTALDGFTLADSGALTLAGPLDAGTATLLLTGAPEVTEPAGSSIIAGTLAGTLTSASLPGTNTIAAIGSLSAPDGLTLTDENPLTLTGSLNVSAGVAEFTINKGGSLSEGSTGVATIALLEANAESVTLPNTGNAINELGAVTAPAGMTLKTANGLAISGAVNTSTLPFSGPIVLTAGGSISETPGGSLTGGTLSGSAGGNASFANTNDLLALGSFTAPGGFTLVNLGGLSLAGPLDAGSATTDLVSLSGNIEEAAGSPAGSISAGTLTASAAGSIVLGDANSIGTLAAITAPGGFTLDNPASFVIAGDLDAGTATVSLSSGGAAVENGGSIIAGLLSGSLGSATLGGANTIAAVAGLSAPSGLSLTDNEALALTGSLDVSAGTADFTINGGLSEGTAGVASLLALAANAASVSLAIPANRIPELDAITAPGGVTLATSSGLAIAGPVNTSALPSSGPIVLDAGGGISEIPGGNLTGGELFGFAGNGTATGAAGNASFGNTNSITALGSFTALGGFTLADSGALTLAGPLNAGTATVSITGLPEVVETTGGITAGTLSGTLASASLGGTNSIGEMANFSATGGFSLADSGNLVLSGPVSAGSSEAAFALSGGNLSQTATGSLTAGTLAAIAGAIDLATAPNTVDELAAIAAPGGFSLRTVSGLEIAGAVDTSSGPIVLTAGGSIMEISGGSLTGATLSGSAAGASLAEANNIVVLGSFAAPGGFTLVNSGALLLEGPLAAGNGTVSFTTASGGLAETGGGSITTDVLTASVPGSIALGGANQIAGLENITAPGGIALNNSGNFVIAGQLDAGNLAVDLTGNGAATESGGSITAGVLTGNLGAANFGDRNLVPVLGAFTAKGLFLLNSASPVLTVLGPLAAGTLDLTASGGLSIAGSTEAGAANLTAGGPISEPGGVISAESLSGTASNVTLTDANTISALDAFSTPGSLLLTDVVPLSVVGPVSTPFLGITDSGGVSFAGSTTAGTLSITTAGSITEPSGSVTLGLLEGSAAGLAQFGPDAPAGSAAITTLGSFSVPTGTFTLTDAIPLSINGPLDANYFAIAAPGSIVLLGADITTLGLPPAQQIGTVPTRPGSFFSVTTGGGQFLALGRTTIDPPAGPDTVRIQLPPSGGLIEFANLAAPTTTLILDTGTGTAIGTIDVAALVVVGNLGSSNLSGTIGSLSGVVASSKATISPFQSTRYRLNSCPLMSINCVFIPPIAIPQGNPLAGLMILAAPPSSQDIDFLLPNVATKDY